MADTPLCAAQLGADLTHRITKGKAGAFQVPDSVSPPLTAVILLWGGGAHITVNHDASPKSLEAAVSSGFSETLCPPHSQACALLKALHHLEELIWEHFSAPHTHPCPGGE